MEKSIIEELSKAYRGLKIPIKEGISKTQLYRQEVLMGKNQVKEICDFEGDERDQIIHLNTPEGMIEVIYLEKRNDFENFVRKIAYRCEPENIPFSVGAMMISGVINWEKIDDHKRTYLSEDGKNWNEEFRKFTSVAENFKDSVLIVSGGPYSGCAASDVGYSPAEWKQISINIRIYHEATHYVCRKRWPEKKDAVVDEVIADAIGLIGAIGKYNKKLALLFLGFTKEEKFKGGRLSVYIKDEQMDNAIETALLWIDYIENCWVKKQEEIKSPFDFLEIIMTESCLEN